MQPKSYISELLRSISVALSPKTIREQWQDLLQTMKPQKKEIPQPKTEDTVPVLKMRVRCGATPDGKSTCITTCKENFTFGNADLFDICLCPDPEEGSDAPDVWCSAFYDKTLDGYVLVQATGSFDVRIEKEKGKYLPGDWSLNNGVRHKTYEQNNVLIPCSDKDDPVLLKFSIAGLYFFEVSAYKTSREEYETEISAQAVTVEQAADTTPQDDCGETPVAASEELPENNHTDEAEGGAEAE